jgi:hypothetical protein
MGDKGGEVFGLGLILLAAINPATPSGLNTKQDLCNDQHSTT